jgi:hypothetical protein
MWSVIAARKLTNTVFMQQHEVRRLALKVTISNWLNGMF